MSEAKFASHPWIIEVHSDKSQVHVYSEDYNYTPHHHKKFFGLELTEADLANAHLVRSAPEMYEMLEDCMCHLFNNCHNAESKELIKKIIELRKKARGEK